MSLTRAEKYEKYIYRHVYKTIYTYIYYINILYCIYKRKITFILTKFVKKSVKLSFLFHLQVQIQEKYGKVTLLGVTHSSPKRDVKSFAKKGG